MSYHQWLSCAPKHHLTSSAQDGFSKSGSNNAHPVAPHHHLATTGHAAVSMLPSNFPSSRTHQAATSAPATAQSFVEKSSSRRIPPSPLLYQPITPPTQGGDNVPYESSADGSHVNASIGSTHIQAYDMKSPTWPSRDGQRLLSPMPPSPSPSPSHDLAGRMPAGKDSVIRRSKTALPSPPSSPQAPLKSVPESTRSKHFTGKPPRLQSVEHWRPTFSDPTMQTSIDPHFWSTNCTVLKADTHLKIGSVISPTCMVGLPFGSMTEMAVPDSTFDTDASRRIP